MNKLIACSTATDLIYYNINSSEIFRKSRNKNNTKKILLYGEVPLLTWKKIVEIAKPKEDGVFFDLGSGAGRVVIQSHLLFNFQKSIGVELLEGLHIAAQGAKENIKIFSKNFDLENREIEFINADIFDVDLSEADFIFLNHPLIGSRTYFEFGKKILKEVKKGTKIVTTIQTLKNDEFKLFHEENMKFCWGYSYAYFFER